MTTDAEEISMANATNGPINNRLGRTGREQDFLQVFEGERAFEGQRHNLHWDAGRQALVARPVPDNPAPHAEFVSPYLACQFPAYEFLPSWNVSLVPGARCCISLRVRDEAGRESPWFFMGEAGPCEGTDGGVTQDADWGKVCVDYLALQRPAAAFQFRVSFSFADAEGELPQSAELHRVFVHYSGPGAAQRSHGEHFPGGGIKVPVPYRSQLDVEQDDLKHIVCCPTCVAMVLESRGINRPTIEICEDVYCSRHKIYGIWPRASQAAFQHGLKSWVHRFRTMADVAAWLQSGRPIIASIRVQEGELRGARYPKSNGHLIVITGITPDGKVLVNDPYSAGPGGEEIEYERADIETCWLDRGGVAIVVE